ncbi:MAG: (2Fe-2S)-binding protein [Deltaproteobacteria bacterium]|jgi:NADH dehydrogenase/NADH:ubiquinone oxidoreductase subunit G|nr:(2Fe-2S)-binding protein [Deltaproteobacteria bacterium]
MSAPTETMVTGTINGRTVAVAKDTPLLQAARDNGVGIPTLCHHPALPPDGNCRLCLVEVGGKLAASCLYPLREDGFSVVTESGKITGARAFVVKLLLSRAPEDECLLRLAALYQTAPDPRLAGDEDGCLRCGRCVRACHAAGSDAVALVGRGRSRKVAGAFFEPPADCAGCLACARVCPTGAVKFRETKNSRSIWGKEFSLAPCPVCGRTVGTPEELARAGLAPGDALCPECRRRAMAGALLALPENAAPKRG